MDPQDVVDIGREAILISLMISAPVLVVGMVVGLAVGLLQALTQIQEQTVARGDTSDIRPVGVIAGEPEQDVVEAVVVHVAGATDAVMRDEVLLVAPLVQATAGDGGSDVADPCGDVRWSAAAR